MALKPWYNVAIPREDLREGRPLDASEFAVHLDQVRDGRAPAVYQQPERFFERTFLTENLLFWSGELPAQKWMNFYTEVLSKFATGKGLTLRVSIEVRPDEGLSSHKIEDTKLALRELGLPDDIEVVVQREP